jgi:hypothetical protein
VLLILLIAGMIALVTLITTQVAGSALLEIDKYCYPPFATLLVALAALVVWIWNVRRQYSEDMFRQCQIFFEKSFETLNVLDDAGLPENSRMQWLTSARLLKQAQKIGAQIELKSHRILYKEIEEYWRSKYYDLVEPHGEGFPEDYFRRQSNRSSDPRILPLDISSLAVIFRFTQLHDEPLENEPRFSDDEIRRMRKVGPRGLGRFLRLESENQE